MIHDSKHPHRNKTHFNYFDYIKAWDIAFCYDNRQKKHSWFIQIKNQEGIKFPQWFVKWFSEWGLYPIILPQKIRVIFEDFKNANPSMKNHCLMFAALYQVPWICKWDVTVSKRNIEKFGVNIEIPFLGRRILTKWWDKFEFFKDSIFSVQGIICFEQKADKKQEPKKDASEILKELLSGSSKKDLKNQLIALLESSSSDEDEDPMLQDSQDPNEDDGDDFMAETVLLKRDTF